MPKINLRTEVQLYKSLMDYHPDMVLSVDAEGRLTGINTAGEDLLGFPQKDILGKSFHKFLPKDVVEEVTCKFRKTLNGGPQNYQCPIIRKDGQVGWFDVTNVPIILDQQIVGVYSIAKDMTVEREQKTMLQSIRKRLEDSNRWFKDLIEVAPVGMIIHQNERIAYVNQKALDIVKATDAASLVGNYIYDFVDPKYHDVSRERMANPLVGKTLPLHRMELLCCNGEVAFVEVASQHIKFENSIATMVLFIDVSQRVEKEREIELLIKRLAESESQYRLIADNSDGMIGILDPNGVIEYASPSHERILGFSPSELEGQLAFDKVYPDDVWNVERLFTNLVASKLEVDVQCRYLKADASYIWVEAHGTPILNEENDIVQVLVVARDISERRSHLEELRKSEEKYRLISENSMDLIATLNRDGVITYASPSFERVLGAHPSDFEGRFFLGLINPAEVPMMVDKYEAVLQTKEPLQVVYHYQHATGGLIPVEADIIPVHGEDGEVDSVLCVAQDVRSRIQMQQALKDNEKRYSLIAKNSSDLIRLVSSEGIITFASPSHQTLLGIDWGEFLGQSYLFGVHPDDLTTVKNNFESTFNTRQPFLCEYRRQCEDGAYLWVESTGTPVFDDKHNITGVVMVSRNINDRKKHEEQLEYLALHDSLTGLPNRRMFMDRTQHALAEAKRDQHGLAVLFLDCDEFKKINDTYGHDVGDEVIKESARRIASTIRECDTAARLGGDEFTVLLPYIESQMDAIKVAKRILQSMTAPWIIGEYEFSLTASIGVAVYPSDGEDEKTLVKHADEALYNAKDVGKDTYRCYSSGGK